MVENEVGIDNIELELINPNAKLINVKKLIAEYDDRQLTDCFYVMEHIGRLCYNSYDKPKNDEEVVKFLKHGAGRGHRSIFEFGQLRFMVELDKHNFGMVFDMLYKNKYVTVNHTTHNTHADSMMLTVIGSPRAFIEILEEMIKSSERISYTFYIELYNALQSIISEVLYSWETATALVDFYDDIHELVADSETLCHVIRDITADYTNPRDNTKFLFLIQCSRSESHEIVRHRPCSFMQASQRYIRYNNKNPYMICLGKAQAALLGDTVKAFARKAFDLYTELLVCGKAEDARVVLPNCTETKIFVYCDKTEYRHFFRMRQSVFAYPPVKEVFDSIYQKLIDKKYI